MDRRHFLRGGSLLAATTLIGCRPPWAVIVQTAPDPFLGQRHFAVQPIDFTALTVGDTPEPVYLAGKDAGQRASFAADKEALNERFLQQLITDAGEAGIQVVPATGPADSPFTIRPSVSFIEPGFYAFVAAIPSHVRMNVRILAPDGRVFDEIVLNHFTPSDMFARAASGSRLREDGAGLGKTVAKYLRVRVGVPD
jgi:hypothetical protein